MRHIFLSLILFVGVCSANAQEILHIKGVKNVNASAGVNLNGYLISTGFEYFLGSKLFLHSSMVYEASNTEYTDNKIYGVIVDLNYAVLTVQENMFFSLSLGAGGAYGAHSSRVEDINDGGFSYSLLGGANYEFMAFERISLFLKYNQVLYTPATIGVNSSVTTGVKFYFY